MSKTGEVVDGFHRINAKADWRREVREDIDTPEKVLIARLISNKFRRQVSAEEVKGWINDLAELALKERGVQPGEISGWVAEETGYAERTVRDYLDEKYKNMEQASYKGKTEAPPASIDFISEVKEITQKNEPTIDFETPTGLLKAVKILKKEAKKKAETEKTPEQLKLEKDDLHYYSSGLRGVGGVLFALGRITQLSLQL